MLRKSAPNRKSLDDSSNGSASGWMWQSQSLAMSLMDNDHSAPEKSISISEDVSVTPDARTVYRLVDRASKFHQAKYPISVQRILPLEEVFKLFYAKDPVLALTNLSTGKGFLVMLVFFIASCALTALPWYLMGQNKSYQEDCAVETTGFQRAFIFSTQIIMTIGFGTKDIFFGDCHLPTIVLTVHCGVSLLVQSIIMGIIYQRLSRATSRRHTVVFSNNAVIRRIKGKLYFMLQSKQAPEEEDVLFTQTFSMRLSQPNDDVGSKILLSTPQVVVHEIDAHSPLRPPAEWVEERKTLPCLPPRGATRASLAFKGIHTDTTINTNTNTNPMAANLQPTLDGSLDEESGGSSSSGARTVHNSTGIFQSNDYQFPEIVQNKGKGVPFTEPSSTDHDIKNNDTELEKVRLLEVEKEEIQSFLRDKNAEIVVVLEGVDPMTSHNVQSYHSYVSAEIKWDHFFVHCTSVINGWATVDFTKFHLLKKCSANESSSGVHESPSVN